MVPNASLSGKALLAINIHDKAEMGLILECSSLGDQNEVQVAQTRQEAVWESRERVAEEAELSETRPVVRTPGSLNIEWGTCLTLWPFLSKGWMQLLRLILVWLTM